MIFIVFNNGLEIDLGPETVKNGWLKVILIGQ